MKVSKINNFIKSPFGKNTKRVAAAAILGLGVMAGASLATKKADKVIDEQKIEQAKSNYGKAMLNMENAKVLHCEDSVLFPIISVGCLVGGIGSAIAGKNLADIFKDKDTDETK